MPFTWTAFYRDGGHAEQRRGHGLELDTAALKSIQLADHQGRPFLEQLFEPQQRAIYHVLPATPISGLPCHMLGWQETLVKDGRKISAQHVCYASEDGRIVMAGRYDDALPWFAQVRPCDDRIPDLTWVAYYEDGKVDPMVEPVTRAEISGEQLDRGRLLSMVFYGNGGLPWFEQYFDRGQRMIFRRRVFEGPADRPRVVNLLGWQRTAAGPDGRDSNVQHIAYAVADTSIVMGGAFQADHPWFHAPVYVPADAWEVGAAMPSPFQQRGWLMAFKSIGVDRVLEYAYNPGTGPVTLNGAVNGFRAFANVLTSGDTCPYYIEGVDGGGMPNGYWERGFGTITGTTLARSIVIDGTNGPGVPVNITSSARIGIAPMSDLTAMYSIPGGRLNGIPGGPVGDTPVGGTTTLYYMPYLHDRILLWDGYGMRTVQFATLTMDLTGLATQTAWDIFGYITPAGALALERYQWTNPTTRAAGLTTLNGFFCKNGDPTRRYLGSFYIGTVAGTTYDIAHQGIAGGGGRRFVWNMYNRVARLVWMYENTSSWTYNVQGFRAVNGRIPPAGGVEVFRGRDEDAMSLAGQVTGNMTTGANPIGYYLGIGTDGANANGPSSMGQAGFGGSMSTFIMNVPTTVFWNGSPGLGYHMLILSEYASAAGAAVSFGGNYGLANLSGTVLA